MPISFGTSAIGDLDGFAHPRVDSRYRRGTPGFGVIERLTRLSKNPCVVDLLGDPTATHDTASFEPPAIFSVYPLGPLPHPCFCVSFHRETPRQVLPIRSLPIDANPALPSAAMEYVYVVPREDLFPDCYPHGLVPFGAEAAGELLNTEESFLAKANAEGFFVERPRAERTPAWKQIIPYGVVICDDRILVVRRLAQGGESRLHDKLSIGIGGHINPVDDEPAAVQAAAGADLFSAAALRELEEELKIEGTYTTRSVGVLNDDSNPVGAVHLGLVLVVQVRGTVEIRETDVLAGEWATREELKERLASGANFETWSRLLVEQIDTFLPHSKVPVA